MAEPLKIQSILYESDPESTVRFLNCLQACTAPEGYWVFLHFGDGSKERLLDDEAVAFWAKELGKRKIEFQYSWFNENLGVSRGHNRLFEIRPLAERLIIMNPDSVFPPHLLTRLNAFADERPQWGIVEARQIPLEHPKDYDPDSFQTSWASTACSLFNVDAFQRVGGFDEHFFMYSDDVDISWRIRALQRPVYYCINTFVYHAKRLTARGVEASRAELYYGTLNSMLLRAKYGHGDLNKPVIRWLKRTDDPAYQNVLHDYRRLRKEVIPATAAERKMATFAPDGNFARHRWHYRDLESEAGA
jgi:GT2 family glycosyltransferase